MMERIENVLVAIPKPRSLRHETIPLTQRPSMDPSPLDLVQRTFAELPARLLLSCPNQSVLRHKWVAC